MIGYQYAYSSPLYQDIMNTGVYRLKFPEFKFHLLDHTIKFT